MPAFTSITPDFAVSGAIRPADLADLAAAGFRTVINNRPDGEEAGQASAAEMAAEASRLGLGYLNIPTRMADVFTEPVVGATVEALQNAAGPILAYCKSGTRSAIAWAAATARERPVEEIMATLRAAGLQLAFLRNDLESQADRGRWLTGASAEQPSSGAGRRLSP